MSATNLTESAARYLARGRVGRERLIELESAMRPANESEAYLVQSELHRLLTDAGKGPVTGHKIGCTTAVMQQFLRIHNPCAGGVFAPTVINERGAVDFMSYLHVGVECEIAARLTQDLRPGPVPHDQHSVASAVGSLMAAIEIVDDRWSDYTTISAATLIADDFFGAGAVLGTPVEDWADLDLGAINGGMTINGESVGQGVGSDILGHPLAALAWLARSMNERADYLRAGEFVLLGSLVKTVWVNRGDVVEVQIEGLGSAGIRFE